MAMWLRLWRNAAALLGILALLPAMARPGFASSLVTLHAFTGPDGSGPAAPLLYHDGVLYGTTVSGGADGTNSNCPGNDCGVVFGFDLTSATLTPLHSFVNGPTDGAYPKAGLLYDHGLLLGTTEGGGRHGQGTLFVLDPARGKSVLLHSFSGGLDGGAPTAGLTRLGKFYFGTTTLNDGTLFQARALRPHVETRFTFAGTDGYDPLSTLSPYQDQLVGTAYEGGANGAGNVFAYDPKTASQTVLYAFTGSTDGGNPAGGVSVANGQIFGTTYRGGGSCACGTIFQLDPSTGILSVLYTFNGGHDGAYPQGDLLLTSGALYGTTRGAQSGCDGAGCGTIFRFDLKTRTFSTLYEFSGGADGGLPLAGLTLHDRTFYGTTSLGGGSGCGGAGCGTLFAFNP